MRAAPSPKFDASVRSMIGLLWSSSFKIGRGVKRGVKTRCKNQLTTSTMYLRQTPPTIEIFARFETELNFLETLLLR